MASTFLPTLILNKIVLFLGILGADAQSRLEARLRSGRVCSSSLRNPNRSQLLKDVLHFAHQPTSFELNQDSLCRYFESGSKHERL